VRGYHLLAIVKADSPFQKLADLKGRKVAHTSPSSNSGNLAPRALFPAEGLTPGTDYQPIMSGGHDRSVLGVNTGDYDMGAVASDVFDRMGNRGTVKADSFRIIYKSTVFPTSSFAHAHDLAPALAAKVKQCFYDFKFPAEMVKEFNGDDRFLPITYLKDWAPVREVAEKTNTPYNRAAYDAEARREAEAAARRAAPPAAAPRRGSPGAHRGHAQTTPQTGPEHAPGARWHRRGRWQQWRTTSTAAATGAHAASRRRRPERSLAERLHRHVHDVEGVLVVVGGDSDYFVVGFQLGGSLRVQSNSAVGVC
jgi:hypothetical protein